MIDGKNRKLLLRAKCIKDRLENPCSSFSSRLSVNRKVVKWKKKKKKKKEKTRDPVKIQRWIVNLAPQG